jgi:hypothetical protein
LTIGILLRNDADDEKTMRNLRTCCVMDNGGDLRMWLRYNTGRYEADPNDNRSVAQRIADGKKRIENAC